MLQNNSLAILKHLLFLYLAVHFSVFSRGFSHNLTECGRKFACIIIAASGSNLHNRKGSVYKL